MTDINKGETGQVLIVNLGEDISTASETLIIAQPEFGTTKEFIATVPNVAIVVNGETLNANEYAEYTTASEEDLDYAGRWRMKLKATFGPTDVRQTNFVKFRVLD